MAHCIHDSIVIRIKLTIWYIIHYNSQAGLPFKKLDSDRTYSLAFSFYFFSLYLYFLVMCCRLHLHLS